MLLTNLVTAGPNEVVPVIALELHIRHARLAVAIPNTATVPIHPHQVDFTDSAIVQHFHVVDVALLVAALQADADQEVAVDATENAILGHIHPVVKLLLIAVHAVLGLLGVHIRHSDQTSIAARVPDLRNGATTTATATD